MNIFFIYLEPEEAARHHGDKHVIKMILESVQMLGTTWHVLHPNGNWTQDFEDRVGRVPYRKAFQNHPCSAWARVCHGNYQWLCRLASELCREKRHRWPGTLGHACEPMIQWFLENSPFPEDDRCTLLTPPAKAMPFQDTRGTGTSIADSLDAYRKYYAFKESRGIVEYKRRPDRRPTWLP
jgi:hypothetical protein